MKDDEQSTTLLEPEVVLPEQFFAGACRDRRQGEHRLMAAILDDAVFTFCMPEVARARGGYRAVREAGDWIESSDRSWTFSFERICDALDLDAEYIRRGVRELKQRSRRRSGVVIDFPSLLPEPMRLAAGSHRITAGRITATP